MLSQIFNGIGGVIGGALDFGGKLAGGAVGSVSNIINSTAAGFGSLFPTTTKQRLDTEILGAGGSGKTYRLTIPENQSMIDTMAMHAQNWLGTPYEQQYAVIPTTEMRDSFASQTSAINQPTKTIFDDAFDFVSGATKEATGIVTAWNEFAYDMGFKERPEVEVGKPRNGWEEGRDVVNSEYDKASVIDTVTAYGNAMLGQIKGLFNTGFTNSEKQPVNSILPSSPLGGSIGGSMLWIIIIGLVILFLVKRK